MASIHLDRIAHQYGGDAYALMPSDLHFEDGKTYALLGPSGCGKTTLLNIISGLVRASEGVVRFDDTDVSQVRTEHRNIAQVFQFPAIYQSKSVYENLAFPLRCRRYDAARIRARVTEVAEILGLQGRLSRSARSLTADEKQLISLGRGLVRDDVAAILMDEPLTVIDPQLKFELRRKIKQANQHARQTVIYVTHDQNEAMSIADEVLVMDRGRVVQRGTPDVLFEFPATTYVGYFIGSPGMNFAALESIPEGIAIGSCPLPDAPASVVDAVGSGQAVSLGIRPEHLQFAARSTAGAVPATVQAQHDLGRAYVVDVMVGGATLKVKVARRQAIPTGDTWLWLPPERRRYYLDGGLMDAG
ncbi:ABC transporter ATP-binding protein [Castellaniella sp. FW104-16D08]|uniref:ABC transporter ATP-binding protein n=1 Tax=unclassified Castellaniella TaxID=2617606 RepID=UPI003314BD8A